MTGPTAAKTLTGCCKTASLPAELNITVQENTLLVTGNVRLDTIGRELTIGGLPVRLSRRELTILEQMMRRFGRIVPKTVLEEKLYGIDEEPDSNPIPVHVHHLRRQLEAAGASLAIHTIRGVGYILADMER